MHRSFLPLLLTSLASLLPSASAPAQLPASFGGVGQDYGKAATIDNAGNFIIAGLYQGSLDFNPGPGLANLTSVGGTVDTVLTKYDSTGNFVWAKSIGGAATNVPHAVGVDALNNVYFAGYFGLGGTSTLISADFDPGVGVSPLTNTGGFDPCVAKYDPNGNLLWARTIGSPTTKTSEARAWDMAVAPGGEVVITGFHSDTFDLNPNAGTNLHPSAGGTDAFVVKLDASGTHQWSFGLGTAGDDEGLSVALDRAGHLFLSGYFTGALDVDPSVNTTTLTSAGVSDLFVARYDAATGEFQKAIRLGGTSAEVAPPGSMRVGPDGRLYLSGRFRGVVDLDPGANTANLTNTGVGATDEIFLAAYDAELAYVWAFNVVSDGGLDGAHRIGFDANGHLIAAGWFSGQADFDGNPGTSAILTAHGTDGASDLFLAKYNLADGSFVWAKNFGAEIDGAENNAIVAGLAVAPDGSSVITGQIFGPTDFDPSASVVMLTSTGANDLFIARYDAAGNLAVPEPSATVSLLSGVVMLVARRRGAGQSRSAAAA